MCETTLDQSNAPVAERMKTFIRVRIAAGDSEQEIKDALVAQFGPGVLAEPPAGGFGLSRGCSRSPRLVGWGRRRHAAPPSLEPAEPPSEDVPDERLDPELERLVDDELARFDG